MLKDLEMMQRENSQLVQPQLKRLNEEIADGKEECGRYDAAAAKLAEASAEIQSKVEALEKETKDAEEEKALLVAELAKLRGDPARLKYAPLLGSGRFVSGRLTQAVAVCLQQASGFREGRSRHTECRGKAPARCDSRVRRHTGAPACEASRG